MCDLMARVVMARPRRIGNTWLFMMRMNSAKSCPFVDDFHLRFVMAGARELIGVFLWTL